MMDAPRTQSARILLACQPGCARYFGVERPVWVSQTLVAVLVGPSYPVIRFVEDGMRIACGSQERLIMPAEEYSSSHAPLSSYGSSSGASSPSTVQPEAHAHHNPEKPVMCYFLSPPMYSASSPTPFVDKPVLSPTSFRLSSALVQPCRRERRSRL